VKEIHDTQPTTSPRGLDFDAELKAKILSSAHSLRALAYKAGVSAASLSLFMNGKYPLSDKTYTRLTLALELNTSEKNHLDLLREWKFGQTAEHKLRALNQLYRLSAFRRVYKNQIESSQYLTHWLYVAIRELATIPGFILDAQWIQNRLTFKASPDQIKSALKFLIDQNFIHCDESGRVSTAERELKCEGDLFLFSMSVYHRQMLELAKEALQNSASSERTIEGITLSLTQEDRDVLSKEWARLQEKAMRLSLASTGKGQQVFQIEFAMFPLSKAQSKEQTSKPSPTETKQ
jgi:uncharacterized protein (TIGR02147 family)